MMNFEWFFNFPMGVLIGATCIFLSFITGARYYKSIEKTSEEK